MILSGHVYRDQDWWLMTLGCLGHVRVRRRFGPLSASASAESGSGRLAGYLVAVQGVASSSPGVHIYEVVGEDEDIVERLIRYACGLSANGRISVGCLGHVRVRRRSSASALSAPHISLANPVRAVLRRMGFVEEASTPYIMARILRPDRIFQRLAAGSDLLRTLSLTVFTPHRTLVVNDPPSPRYRVQIETKESTLSRLFCCRLNLEAALDMEMVRWNGRDPGLKRELGQVFEFTEWVQWFTDFV